MLDTEETRNVIEEWASSSWVSLWKDPSIKMMIMWLLLTRGLQYTIDGNDVLAAASTLYIANTHEPEMKRIFFFPIKLHDGLSTFYAIKGNLGLEHINSSCYQDDNAFFFL